MTDTPEKRIMDVVADDGRYSLAAFAFLHDGLARAASEVHGSEPRPPDSRHVTGPQLCCALRDEARERWGMLAATVLARWNIHASIDFGNMVYVLVDNDLMQKTDEDSIEDFRDVFDFADAFGPEGIFEASE